MKIKGLTLENFKSFAKIEIVDLLSVNMIYGYNNSGKSNLFKFLELVFSSNEVIEKVPYESAQGSTYGTTTRTENFWEKTISNQPFIFRKEKDKRHKISFTITVTVSQAEIQKLVSNGTELLAHFNITEDLVDVIMSGEIIPSGDYNAFQRLTKVALGTHEIFVLEETGNKLTFPGIESETLTYKTFESLLSIFNDCVLFLDNDRYFVNEKEQEPEDKNIHSKNFKNKIFSHSLSHAKEEELKELVKFIRKFHFTSADGVIKNNELSNPFQNFNFEFVRLNGEIEIMLTNEFGRFPLSSFGTGIQQVVYILSRIFLSNRKIILIEEIELNLSHMYQSELIKFIFNKLINEHKFIDQMFYTTHSPLLCYWTQFRSMQARIDDKGISTIIKHTPSAEHITQLKAALTLLETYQSTSTAAGTTGTK